MQARNGRLIRRRIPVVIDHRGDTAAWLGRSVGIISIAANRTRSRVTAQVAERAMKPAGRLRSATPGQCSRSGAYSSPGFRQWREPADRGQAVRTTRGAKSTGDHLPRFHRSRIPLRRIVGEGHTGVGQEAAALAGAFPDAAAADCARPVAVGPHGGCPPPAFAPGESPMSYRRRNFATDGYTSWTSGPSSTHPLGPSSRAMAS
jgi:hypothetical protein